MIPLINPSETEKLDENIVGPTEPYQGIASSRLYEGVRRV